jgi:hypothetical protein
VKYRYVVYYGSCTSRFEAPNWREAAAFIKHCLDNDTPITSIKKVPR